MSRGSMDYLTYKVAEVATDLQRKANTPLQRAFGVHIAKVADALHDVEWVWSGDYGQGDDTKAIEEVLGKDSKSLSLQVLKKDAEELIDQLHNFIK